MNPVRRRIVAIAAHQRGGGAYPKLIYSLGTGEAFAIEVLATGFRDVVSGIGVIVSGGQIVIGEASEIVELSAVDDVSFVGVDDASGEVFSCQAGGGISVTVYDQTHTEFWQYAVIASE